MLGFLWRHQGSNLEDSGRIVQVLFWRWDRTQKQHTLPISDGSTCVLWYW